MVLPARRQEHTSGLIRLVSPGNERRSRHRSQVIKLLTIHYETKDRLTIIRSFRRDVGGSKKLLSLTTEIIHTRLQLAVTELEEEKSRFFRLFLLTGLSLMFTAFGAMSLRVYALLIADPYDRPATLLRASVAFIIYHTGCHCGCGGVHHCQTKISAQRNPQAAWSGPSCASQEPG